MTITILIIIGITLALYFEYQNAKEDREENKRPSS
tara:strand:+ start:307 stop:411 length:105 start_codon:yes stop_codon:yes gene_type:complete